MSRFWSSFAFFKIGLILPTWQVNSAVRSWSRPEVDPGIGQEHGQNDLKVLPVVNNDGKKRGTSIITGRAPKRTGGILRWREVYFRWFYWGRIALRGYKVENGLSKMRGEI